jgi:fatty acid/phospholipid biosynthesis enzyme
VRRIFGRLVLLSAAAGAFYALLNYLRNSEGAKKGDVQMVLDTGATVEPDPAEAQEFADIARKVLEIDGENR